MPTYVAEAFEIITDDGRGIPVSVGAIPAIGLAADGHIVIISGRFHITAGDGKIITGDTTRTTWYDKVLAQDFFAGLSRNANFIEAGCIEEVSGMALGLVNTDGFFSTLKANGIYLANRIIKYYRVTSADGITFNFEQRWQGVVDEQPYTELRYSIQCLDSSKSVFKSVPIVPLDETSFSESPQESRDKFIPIAIGRVAYAPLVNITQSGKKVILNIIDGVEYKIAGVTGIHGSPVDGLIIQCDGVEFVDDDPRLVGKYLSVIIGKPQSLRIKATFASGVTGHVRLDTDDPPDTEGIIPWALTPDGVADVWYVEISDFNPTLVVSTKPVALIKNNPEYRPSLAVWKSDRNVYDDVSEMRISESETSIKDSGYPGYSILAASADTDGALFSYFNVSPTSIIHRINNFDSTDLPAVDAACPYLNSRAISSNHYTLNMNGPGSVRTCVVGFSVFLPSDDILKQFTDLYVLPDMVVACTSVVVITASVWMVDFYGRIGEKIVDEVELYADDPPGSLALNFLPGAYYGAVRDDINFYTNKIKLNVADILGDTKKAKAYNTVYINLNFELVSISTLVVGLYQIGMIGKRSVGVTSETIYGRVHGETYGDPAAPGDVWDNRRPPDESIGNPVDAIEHLIRNYDESAPGWQASTAYVIGDHIRSSLDNGHIFVCTVPGTSHATTEPTWTDTAGATYADGTATWKELREIPIDTTSFDSASSDRDEWFIGHSITKKEDTEGIIKHLVARAFIIMTTSKKGKMEVKAWRENTSTSITFDEGSIIGGSIGEMKLTPMSQAYNDFLIRYDENPGAGRFNRQIAVTKTDKPVFPVPTEFMDGTIGAIIPIDILYYTYPVAGQYQIGCNCLAAHSLHDGDLISITGNADNYDCPPTAVQVTGIDSFRYLTNKAPTADPSSSGTLFKASLSPLKWKSYVTGIIDYAVAKDLWDDAHAAYCITKTVKKLPDDLGDCPWFIDPYAKDAAGNYIWNTEVPAAPFELDVGDEHPAVFYLRNLIAWSSRQKEQITFEVIDNATYSAIGIGDPINVNDAKQTGGASRLGWVHEKTQLSRTKSQPERFRFGVTLDPT